MHFNQTLLTAGLLLSLNTLNAQAALTVGTSNGQSVVYSSVSNITWTRDADLLNTLANNQGYTTLVDAILAASPVSSFHIVSTADFSRGYNVGDFITPAGYYVKANWFGAQAFVSYLNHVNYAGSNQWTLPSPGSNPQTGNHPAGSQMGELYYNELGGTLERAPKN